MIKAIVFDIGGVLVENPKYGEFWENVGGSEELRKSLGMGEISVREFIKRGAKMKNTSEENFLKKYKESYWTGNLIRDVFEIYKKIKLKKYIFSDTNPIHLEYLQNNFKGIFDIADKSVTDKRKSEDDSYNELIKKIGLSASEILFIDDKKKYLDKAKNFGIKTILFESAEQLIKDLKGWGIEI